MAAGYSSHSRSWLIPTQLWPTGNHDARDCSEPGEQHARERRGRLVRRLAQDAPSWSRAGTSGKASAVHHACGVLLVAAPENATGMPGLRLTFDRSASELQYSYGCQVSLYHFLRSEPPTGPRRPESSLTCPIPAIPIVDLSKNRPCVIQAIRHVAKGWSGVPLPRVFDRAR